MTDGDCIVESLEVGVELMALDVITDYVSVRSGSPRSTVWWTGQDTFQCLCSTKVALVREKEGEEANMRYSCTQSWDVLRCPETLSIALRGTTKDALGCPGHYFQKFEGNLWD